HVDVELVLQRRDGLERARRLRVHLEVDVHGARAPTGEHGGRAAGELDAPRPPARGAGSVVGRRGRRMPVRPRPDGSPRTETARPRGRDTRPIGAGQGARGPRAPRSGRGGTAPARGRRRGRNGPHEYENRRQRERELETWEPSQHYWSASGSSS